MKRNVRIILDVEFDYLTTKQWENCKDELKTQTEDMQIAWSESGGVLKATCK